MNAALVKGHTEVAKMFTNGGPIPTSALFAKAMLAGDVDREKVVKEYVNATKEKPPSALSPAKTNRLAKRAPVAEPKSLSGAQLTGQRGAADEAVRLRLQEEEEDRKAEEQARARFAARQRRADEAMQLLLEQEEEDKKKAEEKRKAKKIKKNKGKAVECVEVEAPLSPEAGAPLSPIPLSPEECAILQEVVFPKAERKKKKKKVTEEGGAKSGKVAEMELDECVICLGDGKKWVMFPCLHEALCGGCARGLRVCDSNSDLPLYLRECPVCRCALMAPYVLKSELCGEIHAVLSQRGVFKT
jgi:hypothetical protein